MDPVARALLAWYDQHRRRHLPWREEPGPYRTLVSELMLQQTRVETVIPYFARFMERFPTVDALASAPLDEVLTAWSGLGYYSRARNLHKAASMVVARGGFPTDVVGLRELPGVGPYVAGAIASIALGLDEPTVDGNIERVLSRIHKYIGAKAGIWELARGHLPLGRAGDFNQALMDLGSAICTPKRPGCLVCPLREGCGAQASGEPEAWPQLPPRKKAPGRQAVAAVLRRGDKVLLGRRPAEGLFGGLYELPGVLLEEREGAQAGLARTGWQQLGQTLMPGVAIGTVHHTLTHMKLELQLFEAELAGEPDGSFYTAFLEVDPEAPGQLGLSTLARKALALVGAAVPTSNC